MKNENRVSVKQAAEELGIDVVTLRWMMENGELPIGRYVKRPGSKRGMFLIYRNLLDRELGKGGIENDEGSRESCRADVSG